MSNPWHHLNTSDNLVPHTCNLFDQKKNSEFQFSQRLMGWNYSNFKSCAVLQTFHTTKEGRHSEGELRIFYEYFCSHLTLDLDTDVTRVWSISLQSTVGILLWFVEIINQNVNFCWIKVCLGAKMNMSHTVRVFSQVQCFLVKYLSRWLIMMVQPDVKCFMINSQRSTCSLFRNQKFCLGKQ